MYFVEHQGLCRLPGDVPDLVRHHRNRQRLDLPDDPVDLPRGKTPRGARAPGETGRAAAVKAASIESAAALGFIGAIGASADILIPRGFGASIAATGAPHLALGILPRLLRDLPGADLVVLSAPEFRGARARRASPKRGCEPIMTPEQVNGHSGQFCQGCADIRSRLPRYFTARLFEIAPSVKPLFHGDMKEQGRKLMATLAVVVNGLDQSAGRPARSHARSPNATWLRRQSRALHARRRGAAVDARNAASARIGRRNSRRPGAAAYGVLSGIHDQPRPMAAAPRPNEAPSIERRSRAACGGR